MNFVTCLYLRFIFLWFHIKLDLPQPCLRELCCFVTVLAWIASADALLPPCAAVRAESLAVAERLSAGGSAPLPLLRHAPAATPHFRPALALAPVKGVGCCGSCGWFPASGGGRARQLGTAAQPGCAGSAMGGVLFRALSCREGPAVLALGTRTAGSSGQGL